ncbi:MAG: hypothetical protein ABJD11_11945, partial [Gemmatimonadota bacterium]
MDLYTFSLILGAAGLVVMAVGGLGSHFHIGGHGHSGHGGRGGHAPHTGRGAHSHAKGEARWSIMALLSPRLIFGVLFGFGATGLLGR